MPPKKELSSSVHQMPHERQVELLSEALLREYMHKRKFAETLRAFDEENPRDSDTISSRALMSDLMALKPETQRLLKADGVETIMEMLCYLRVKRRLELEELKRQASVEPPPTPEKAKKKSKDKKKSSTKHSSEGSLRHERSKHDNSGREKKSLSSNRSSNSDSSSESEVASDRGSSGSFDHKRDSSVGRGLARSIIKLLCGENEIPTSFLKQGFVFDEDVEYGLIEWDRGPEGIIAVVQAYICAFFFKGGFVDIKRHQQQCLQRALMTLLSSAQPDPSHVCLVNGSIRENEVNNDLKHLILWRDFATAEDIEQKLHSVLEDWMEPRGSGVFCFFLSVLLSRGIKKVATTMSSANGQLINSEGCCSSDVAKILLHGEEDTTSSSYLLQELTMGGSTVGMSCGYVSTGQDDTSLNEVGAKTPRYPVWVVHHQSRFAVLFLKRDTRRQFEQNERMGMPAFCDIFFYEPGAPKRDERFLSVSSTAQSPEVGGSNEENSSFLYAAVRKIPLWCDGEIDWNGFKPVF
ncbi:uncharacterized protein TM35_000045540 [Trypanosoma theileri]|uniref:Probable ubiquitin carboxyl-terminal hydrolase MINDY-4 n=1 Tax=Trypanosoma theileri TaxID=67003 RepID=A0A1X0P7D8_9TRYP|nr:uncharacterized protein TM35_000045540 [Trypanosoma theileri]ORC92340.1 hypothetical protein TM35_000045540 [Trypanosoma theileri]